MGSEIVDQIGPLGSPVMDRDTTLSAQMRVDLVLEALPGACIDTYLGRPVVRFQDQIILIKQVTHLGRPHPAFKKRIQIPRWWFDVTASVERDGLVVRFLGVYRYGDLTLFVDFDPASYLRRAMNNSSAHVATNDLYQAQERGVFERVDSNGNRLVSLRATLLHRYLRGDLAIEDPRADVFAQFSSEIFSSGWIHVLDAVREMDAKGWPDRFQSEWAGFYLEYRFDAFLRQGGYADLVHLQREKRRGRYDFDLVFPDGDGIGYYGDLKASDIAKHSAPGNDRGDLWRCVEEYGRFWYVVVEHATEHARDADGDVAVRWNRLRRSLGQARSDYNDLSYAGKLKAAVLFTRVRILELNAANFRYALGDFHQGKQQSGAERAVKVMIQKRNIDNFLIYQATL